MNKFKESKYFLPVIVLILVILIDGSIAFFIQDIKSETKRSDFLKAPIESQTAAVSEATRKRLFDIFACVAPMVSLTAANTQANPVIVPVPNGICDYLLPATATPVALVTAGNWNVSAKIKGRDGQSYGVEAITHGNWVPYSVDNRYPFGHYKFYFQDPSTSGSATPSGSVSLNVVFAQLPRFKTSNYYQTTQTIRDEVGNSVLGTANKNVYYVNYNQTPLIKFTYKPLIAELFTGLQVTESFYKNGELLVSSIGPIGSSGNVVEFTPTPSAQPGEVYTVRVCPAQSNGTLVEKAICSTSIFITEDDLVI